MSNTDINNDWITWGVSESNYNTLKMKNGEFAPLDHMFLPSKTVNFAFANDSLCFTTYDDPYSIKVTIQSPH